MIAQISASRFRSQDTRQGERFASSEARPRPISHRYLSGVMSVIDWVVRYFSPPIPGKIKTSIDDVLRGASPVICTDKMPLILQHAGHSRTIIGYEINQRGVVNLLTFDPSK